MPRKAHALLAVLLPVLTVVVLLHGCAGGGTAPTPPMTQQVPCRDTVRGCPDLKVSTSMLTPIHMETQTFAADDCGVVEGFVPSAGTFKLMRFTTGFANMGPGDLIVGRPTDQANSFFFEYSPCHGHYHFRGFSTYRLWTLAGYDAWRTLRAAAPDSLSQALLQANPQLAGQMVSGSKRAFCVIDIQRYGGYSGPQRPRQFDDCMTNQGITVGWMDIYGWQTEGNWISVTGVPPGDYVLEVEVNPERLIREADYTNNSSIAQVQIP